MTFQSWVSFITPDGECHCVGDTIGLMVDPERARLEREALQDVARLMMAWAARLSGESDVARQFSSAAYRLLGCRYPPSHLGEKQHPE